MNLTSQALRDLADLVDAGALVLNVVTTEYGPELTDRGHPFYTAFTLKFVNTLEEQGRFENTHTVFSQFQQASLGAVPEQQKSQWYYDTDRNKRWG